MVTFASRGEAVEWLSSEVLDRLGASGLLFTSGAAADAVADEIPVGVDLDDETLSSLRDAAIAEARHRWRLSPGEESVIWEAIDEILDDRGVTCWMPASAATLGAAIRRGGVRRPITSPLQVELALGASSPILADRAIAARHGIGDPPRPVAVISSDGRGPVIEIYGDGSALDVENGAAWADWPILIEALPIAWDRVDADDPALGDEVTRALQRAWPRC